MTREEFLQHIRERIEASVRSAEQELGRPLPRKLAFQWFAPKGERVEDGIEEEICREVFVSPEAIYPCVDIGPWKEEGGVLLIRAIRSGHAPRPFGRNWQGADGPFILVRGGDLAG